ncbi:MAG: serine/threonine protein kinase, partial [Myxococcales bacterium]|nr:serine/threonine protein kinase [Myxococcales bacterium]
MSARLPRSVAAPPSAERERFGKYEILRRIAVGGMAEIYLARALGLEGFEKLVVLKRILPQYADNEEFVQMFLDEARVAATLHHSNVVQVYDIGAVDGQYFLSMEFLHGQDGRVLMKACATRRTPLPLGNALAIGIGVLAGLHYAHERVVDGRPLDLVHRDVSPQNVFITYDGGVKLLDFGIARASSRLTETRGGTLKGKISYMSPEQCAGHPLDRRSDVFAAAIILWEMTVGQRLFSGSSDFEILRKVKEEDAQRPSSVVSDYPRALEEIVMKGLARDREQRYATAEEMQVDLETFARDRKLALSAVPLGRFVRELFKSDLEAWHAAERAGQPGEPLLQTTPSGNLIRTETSI